ncbi:MULTISPECIES: hypothetical protein [Janthinobacterium]|uniref:hypothetical protein n=1 Tax=Janthinobacterium TaxID=29580 RepID=UPI001C5AB018|nr:MULTISPECIES: hypothetical protein [Janthinobacterium]MBW3508165.1 hypothetical protein [Janthinobacterium sp. NKUCC06_STL]MCA1861086.1 hypothetical protein [Janthinobacterium lividum]
MMATILAVYSLAAAGIRQGKLDLFNKNRQADTVIKKKNKSELALKFHTSLPISGPSPQTIRGKK